MIKSIMNRTCIQIAICAGVLLPNLAHATDDFPLEEGTLDALYAKPAYIQDGRVVFPHGASKLDFLQQAPKLMKSGNEGSEKLFCNVFKAAMEADPETTQFAFPALRKVLPYVNMRYIRWFQDLAPALVDSAFIEAMLQRFSRFNYASDLVGDYAGAGDRLQQFIAWFEPLEASHPGLQHRVVDAVIQIMTNTSKESNSGAFTNEFKELAMFVKTHGTLEQLVSVQNLAAAYLAKSIENTNPVHKTPEAIEHNQQYVRFWTKLENELNSTTETK